MKSKITFLAVVLILGLSLFLLTSTEVAVKTGEEYVSQYRNEIYDTLMGKEIEGIDKDTLSPLNIHKEVDSPSKTKTYYFVSTEELSGNGGQVGLILEINKDKKEGRLLSNYGGFFNNPSTFIFSPNEEYFIYDMHWNSGAACSYSYSNLVKDREFIELKPPVDLSQFPDHDTGLGSVEKPYISARNPEWISNNIVRFESVVTSCFVGHEPYPYEETQVWEYNVKTGEYALISEDEKNDYGIPTYDNTGYVKEIKNEGGQYYLVVDRFDWELCEDCVTGYNINMTKQEENLFVSKEAKISFVSDFLYSLKRHNFIEEELEVPHYEMNFNDFMEVFDDVISELEIDFFRLPWSFEQDGNGLISEIDQIYIP